MDIFSAKGLNDFNYLEQKLEKGQVTSLSDGSKAVVHDIAENLYLILISMIPLIFYPVFHHGADGGVNIVNEIFNNPDVMLLSIPYIMHGVLLVSSKNILQGKKVLVGWCSLLIILSILFYLLLKLEFLYEFKTRICIIWVFWSITIISAILGSLLAYLYKKEKN